MSGRSIPRLALRRREHNIPARRYCTSTAAVLRTSLSARRLPSHCLRRPALGRASRGEELSPWRVGEWGGVGSFLVTRAALQRSRAGGPGRARASPVNTRNWHSSLRWEFGQVFADRLRCVASGAGTGV